jgi:Leucine-rich repeat (LRR) protein
MNDRIQSYLAQNVPAGGWRNVNSYFVSHEEASIINARKLDIHQTIADSINNCSILWTLSQCTNLEECKLRLSAPSIEFLQMLLEILACFPRLHTVSLIAQDFEISHWVTMMNGLPTLPHLHTLNLQQASTACRAVHIIAPQLPLCRGLKTLRLDYCDYVIDDDVFAAALPKCLGLEVLAITDCAITDVGIVKVTQCISLCLTLQSFAFHLRASSYGYREQMGITGHGFTYIKPPVRNQILANLAQCSNLRALRFLGDKDHVHVFAKGLVDVAATLPHLKSLQIEFGVDHIGEMAHFTRGLAKCAQLTVLDLTHVQILTGTIDMILAATVLRNRLCELRFKCTLSVNDLPWLDSLPALQVLEMRQFQGEGSVLAEALNGLRNSPNLQILDLTDCQALDNTEAARALHALVKALPRLHSVTLDQIEFNETAPIAELADMVRGNRSLQTLSMQHCDIPESAMPVLALGVGQSRVLNTFNLRHVRLFAAGLRAVVDAVDQARALRNVPVIPAIMFPDMAIYRPLRERLDALLERNQITLARRRSMFIVCLCLARRIYVYGHVPTEVKDYIMNMLMYL